MIVFIEKEPSTIGNSFLRPDLTQITIEKVLPNFPFKRCNFLQIAKDFRTMCSVGQVKIVQTTGLPPEADNHSITDRRKQDSITLKKGTFF